MGFSATAAEELGGMVLRCDDCQAVLAIMRGGMDAITIWEVQRYHHCGQDGERNVPAFRGTQGQT